MAAAQITTVTLVSAIRAELNKPVSGVLSDDEITNFILSHTLAAQSYPFTRIAANYWRFYAGDAYLWAPSFTGIDDCVYTLNARGNIVKTGGTGTDTREQITVAGSPCDYPEVVAEILEFLAVHRSQEISESWEGGSSSPQGVYEQLLQMAAVRRGAHPLG